MIVSHLMEKIISAFGKVWLYIFWYNKDFLKRYKVRNQRAQWMNNGNN